MKIFSFVVFSIAVLWTIKTIIIRLFNISTKQRLIEIIFYFIEILIICIKIYITFKKNIK